MFRGCNHAIERCREKTNDRCDLLIIVRPVFCDSTIRIPHPPYSENRQRCQVGAPIMTWRDFSGNRVGREPE